MDPRVREVLRRQFEVAWALLDLHLATLDTDECLWRPASRGLHVVESPDGVWNAEWPEHEAYSLGPPSIAWITWHLHFWWSMVIDHHLGSATLSRESVTWPGDAERVRLALHAHHQTWWAVLDAREGTRSPLPAESRWPFAGRPMDEVLAWVNLELMKNAAELGQVRFLYAVRGG